MHTTITIKTDKKLRDEAKKTAARLGIPLSTAMNAMLKQFVRDQRLVLEAECPFPSHIPNAETRKVLREARDPKSLATAKQYSNADEMFKDILKQDLGFA
jgi:addiction module RelB/DinJ family antitoxin